MSQRRDSSGIPWLRAASCSSSDEMPSSGLATRADELMLSRSLVTVDPFGIHCNPAPVIGGTLTRAKQRTACAPEGHQIGNGGELRSIPKRAERRVPEGI